MNLQPRQRFGKCAAVGQTVPHSRGCGDIDHQTPLQLQDLAESVDITPRKRQDAEANR